jgi:hypothetical protein
MGRAEDEVMPFGQHTGLTLGEILQDDPRYLDWLRGLTIRSVNLRDAVGVMCERYAADIARALNMVAPSVRAKVYTVAKQGSQWILTKDHNQRFRMGEAEEEALDKAYVTAESEYATLVIRR